jgi:hypothetical protein
MTVRGVLKSVACSMLYAVKGILSMESNISGMPDRVPLTKSAVKLSP